MAYAEKEGRHFEWHGWKQDPGLFDGEYARRMNGGDVYRKLTGYVVPDHEGTACTCSRTVTMLPQLVA